MSNLPTKSIFGDFRSSLWKLKWVVKSKKNIVRNSKGPCFKAIKPITHHFCGKNDAGCRSVWGEIRSRKHCYHIFLTYFEHVKLCGIHGRNLTKYLWNYNFGWPWWFANKQFCEDDEPGDWRLGEQIKCD